MNKPRKYNGVYKLPIHKHTPKRRPISRWKITLRENDEIGVVLRGAYTPLVKDITQNLVKYPLDTNIWKQKASLQTMPTIQVEGNQEFIGILPDGTWVKAKPSLLTRVKERFKRK